MAGTVRRAADGSWVADVTVNGIRKTGKCKTKNEALARKRELLEQLMQRQATSVIKREEFTLKEARSLSMRMRWAGTAYERTAAMYSKQAVTHFGEHTPIAAITARMVDDWRQELLAKNKPSTVNKKVSALKAMISDALVRGHINERPALPQQLKVKNTKDRVISDQERDLFCKYFVEVGEPAAADLFVFMLETCTRWSEVERLKGQDLDLDKGRATFWRTKNGKPRTVPLTRRAIDAVRPHVPAIATYRVWPYKYRRFEYLFDRAKAAMGLAEDKQLTMHCTRHTCASKLSSRNISLQKLKDFGGWSSLAAVQRYLHLNTDALVDCVNALEAGA